MSPAKTNAYPVWDPKFQCVAKLKTELTEIVDQAFNAGEFTYVWFTFIHLTDEIVRQAFAHWFNAQHFTLQITICLSIFGEEAEFPFWFVDASAVGNGQLLDLIRAWGNHCRYSNEYFRVGRNIFLIHRRTGQNVWLVHNNFHIVRKHGWSNALEFRRKYCRQSALHADVVCISGGEKFKLFTGKIYRGRGIQRTHTDCSYWMCNNCRSRRMFVEKGFHMARFPLPSDIWQTVRCTAAEAWPSLVSRYIDSFRTQCSAIPSRRHCSQCYRQSQWSDKLRAAYVHSKCSPAKPCEFLKCLQIEMIRNGVWAHLQSVDQGHGTNGAHAICVTKCNGRQFERV